MNCYSDFYNVTFVTPTITAGQSYIMGSHFRKYILLGSIYIHADNFTMGGCPFLPCLPCPYPLPCLWITPVDKFKRKAGADCPIG